jgi:Tat protein secretion system quality control protein TatD with DNase activity
MVLYAITRSIDKVETRIKQAENAGIYTLAVTTTPRAWPRNYELTDKLHYVRPALGLHPQLVSKSNKDELGLRSPFAMLADGVRFSWNEARKKTSKCWSIFLVNLIESRWDLICEEIIR